MGLAVFYETPALRLWFQSLPWPLGVWVDHGSDIQRYGCLAIEIVVIQSFFVSYSDVQKNNKTKQIVQHNLFTFLKVDKNIQI